MSGDPACGECGSLSLEYREAEYATGVTAPDGGLERRRERWIQCRDCGERYDVEELDRRLRHEVQRARETLGGWR